MKKRAIVIITAVLLCLFSASVCDAKVLVDKEKAGPSATWTLTDDGVMTIQGTGKVNLDTQTFFEKRLSIKKIVIENGITSIDSYGISDIEKATSIHLPESIKSIEENGLCNLASVKKIVLPKGVEILSERMLSKCKSLTKLVLPTQLKAIKENAFEKCYSLQSITIPDGVTTIESGVFNDCNSLKTIVLPKNLKTCKTSFSKARALRKVVNRSKKWIKLDTCKGRRVWKVNGKKVTKLAPGKTATTKGVRYKILYSLSGGKAKGKLPKYYYYGRAPKIPKASRKGYDFLGWYGFNEGGTDVGGHFASKCAKDVHMTAILIKVKVTRLSKTSVRFQIKDSIRWKNMRWYEPGEVEPRYFIRIYEKYPKKNYEKKNEIGLFKKALINRGKTKKFKKLNAKKQYYYKVSFGWYVNGDSECNAYDDFINGRHIVKKLAMGKK